MSLNPDLDSSFTNTTEARNYVKFYRQWVRNNFKSKQEGREVGEEQDYILIISPGNSKTEMRRKVKDADIQQYNQEWNAYLDGKEMQVSGTPIELLPNIPNGMEKHLNSMYIYTIEQLAGMSDLALQNVGIGGHDLRRLAQTYLKGNKEQSVEELEQARLEITTLKTTIEALEAKIAELEKPKRRGRKPKPKPDEAMVLQ